MSEITDLLQDIITPYEGTENNPFTFLRVGRVVKVYASSTDVKDDKKKEAYVGTVDIRWMDRQSPTTNLVPWTYPAFSNPNISKTQTETESTNVSSPIVQTSVGSSSGIFYVPSVGDVVICGFRDQFNPIIIGYLPHNLYKQQQPDGTRDTSFGPFRTLKSGELELKSQQQADIYLDRKGTIQLITKTQGLSTVVPDTELVRISLGVTYDDTFTTPVVSPQGNNVVCNIKLTANDTSIQIDSSGNINIKSAGDVIVNSGTKGAARLDDATLSNSSLDATYWKFISDLTIAFNTHTHETAPLGPVSIPTVTPPAVFPLTAPTKQDGKINSSSTKTKIGD